MTLAFCQDVQAEAYDFPEGFFAERVWRRRRPAPDETNSPKRPRPSGRRENPIIVAGGGVHYSGACEALKTLVEATGIPVAETQAGKSALPWDHPLNMGAIGVTGTASANAIAGKADLVIGVGTRFQDFTTGSWSLFEPSGAKDPGAQHPAFRQRQA